MYCIVSHLIWFRICIVFSSLYCVHCGIILAFVACRAYYWSPSIISCPIASSGFPSSEEELVVLLFHSHRLLFYYCIITTLCTIYLYSYFFQLYSPQQLQDNIVLYTSIHCLEQHNNPILVSPILIIIRCYYFFFYVYSPRN